MTLKFNAVVLAGDRGPSDPVAQCASTHGKAAVEFNQISLLESTLQTLSQAQQIDKIFMLGPSTQCVELLPHLVDIMQRYQATYMAPASGPSASALAGIRCSAHYPTLIVTCDLPLLNAEAVDEFCNAVCSHDADFVAGAVDYAAIAELIPALKKTKYRFSQQHVCFANLFAVLTQGGLKALEFWQSIEHDRKRPIEIIKKIDWPSLIQYQLGKLTLAKVEQVLSARIDAHLAIQLFDCPELAIDVDSAHDYQVLTDYLS